MCKRDLKKTTYSPQLCFLSKFENFLHTIEIFFKFFFKKLFQKHFFVIFEQPWDVFDLPSLALPQRLAAQLKHFSRRP